MSEKDIHYYLNLPYSIVIKKDSNDWFFAYVEELNGCVSQGKSYEEACENIKDAMEMWLEVAIDDNMKIPEPEEIDYSGKFVVRLPKTLHKKLVKNAKKENVSLNQYVIYLLGEQNSVKELSRELNIRIEKVEGVSYESLKDYDYSGKDEKVPESWEKIQKKKLK